MSNMYNIIIKHMSNMYKTIINTLNIEPLVKIHIFCGGEALLDEMDGGILSPLYVAHMYSSDC